MGVRPNSPPKMTSVSSSMPRCFEILEQRRRRLIDLAGDALDVILDAAVMVPVAVIQAG